MRSALNPLCDGKNSFCNIGFKWCYNGKQTRASKTGRPDALHSDAQARGYRKILHLCDTGWIAQNNSWRGKRHFGIGSSGQTVGMKRTKNPFPGVTRAVNPRGKVCYRFRSKGSNCYLPGPYGSVAFRAAYDAAVQGASAPTRSTTPADTLAGLIENYLGSARYKNLSVSRKRSIRGELDWLRGIAGTAKFRVFKTYHVEKLMAKKSGPTAANTVKKNLSILFNFAIRMGMGITFNPARFADRLKVNPDGYHTWTAAEIAQFLAFHGDGTKARLACLLILTTGASRQDVAGMGWQNVQNGVISYRRGKTGVSAHIPIMPDLQIKLRRVPADQMIFVTHGRGLPYKPTTFGNWFKDQCKLAGLSHCSAHGLRKGAATSMADLGGNEYEVMSLLGHSSPKEGATYTKKANRAKLAASGMAKVYGANPEQNLSNLSPMLDTNTTKPIERKVKK